jgi:hypothetical protein
MDATNKEMGDLTTVSPIAGFVDMGTTGTE